jgi:hypothetical protein
MHPEYLCAHCTRGGAAQTVLEAEFGQTVRLSIGASAMPGSPREHPSFAAFAEEAAYSRVLGGIHYRNSMTAGAALGRAIGEQATAGFMQPRS